MAHSRADSRADLARVADAARRVNRAIRVTDVETETLRLAEAALLDAAALLERHEHGGPHCQVGHTMTEGLDLQMRPADMFPFSPITGPLNPISPPVALEVGDDKSVYGTVTLSESYNGPPWNLVHGGVIAAIFDELLGAASIAATGGGFTGRLTVHYRKPTPILEPLDLRGWLASESGRKLVVRGDIRHRGTVTADAEGLFVRVAGVLQDHDDAPARTGDAP